MFACLLTLDLLKFCFTFFSFFFFLQTLKMSEANQVAPGGVIKAPPSTVIDQMLSTLESGEAEDKHCLSHECDIILECKICRNLFRVMNSFLNHKKVHCLQYVVSFTVPLQVSKTSEEKTENDNNATNTEKTEMPAEATSVKDPQKTDQTKKTSPIKSPTKSKEAEKESLSDKSQTKPPTTTVRVTASVENTDPMKLRSPRKTNSSISKKEDTHAVKKDVSNSKKGDVSPTKKDSSQPKKGNSSGHKQEESSSSSKRGDNSSQKKEVAIQKKGETSSHKKNDVSSSTKKNTSSQKREESSRKESSSQKKEGSSVNSRRDRKEDSSAKKGDSSSHKKDDSTRKEKESHKKEESSIPFRIGEKESSSQKKEESSVLSKKDKDFVPFKKGEKESSSQKKEESSVPFKKGDRKKEESSIPFKKGDSSNQKKEDSSAALKKGDNSSTSKKENSSVQKKETASSAKQLDSPNQKKAEAPPPSKKQKTEDSTKKPAEEPKEKVTPSLTTSVTPTSSATPVTPTSSATPVTPTSSATPVTPTSSATPVTPTSSATPVTPTSSATPVTPAPSAAMVTPAPSAAMVTPAPSAPAVTHTPSVPAVTPAPSAPVVTPTPSDPVVTPAPSAPAVTPAPSDPAVTPAPSAPAVTPAPSAPAVTPAPSAPAVTPAPSAPAVAPAPSAPAVAPAPSAPAVTPALSAPAVTPAPSAPAVTPAPSAPAVTPAPSAPAVTPAPSAPAVTPAPSAPAVTAAPSAPTVTPTPSMPAVTPAPSAPTVTAAPSAPAVTPAPSAPTVTATPSATAVTAAPSVPAVTPAPAPAVTPTPSVPAVTPAPSMPAVTLTSSVPAVTPTPSAPAVTPTAPAVTSAPAITPTPSTTVTLTHPAPTVTPALITTSTTTSVPVASTTLSPVPLSPAPLLTTAPDKKVDAQADQDKQPLLTKPVLISAENKSDEPPVLTPEKVSPTAAMEIQNQKQTDASDTLNPLIAGVLDAYQRYKDKNQPLLEDVEKQKSNEAPTTNDKPAAASASADVAAAAETPVVDKVLPEVQEADKNETVEDKEDKAGDALAELDDKNKSINNDDLDKDLNDPERYELRNRLRCPDCGLELTNMSKLAQHMSRHLADSKGHFVCPICQKETRLETFSELILHLRDPHFLKDKQLLPMWRNLMKNCWVDEKDMSATFPVIEAVKRSERSKDKELPEKNYKCPYCKKKPKILRYFSGLIGHLRSEHGLKRCQLQKMQAKLRKTSVVEVKHKKIKKKCMLFKCSFCFKTFTKKSSIKLHVKSCRKRTESTVKDTDIKKRRGRPKTFTKIVAFKTIGQKKSISDNSVPSTGGDVSSEHFKRSSLASASMGDPSTSISTAVNTPRLSSGSFSASHNRDGNSDQNYAFSPAMIQPVKLETFWVSKTPGKPSECIKSTVTNLEKLRTTPSKMFKSSELTKIGNFQCYSCNRYYSFRQHFERHVQLCNHNRKIEEIADFQTLRCLECNQSFSYLQHLKRHAAKHLGLDRFKCKLCNYSSYYWSDTKYHLASHKGVNLKHPEYYILNVSASECLALKPDNTNESATKSSDTPRTVLKRSAEGPPLVATGSSGSGSGVVKTLVLTEQDGMLKVVSDPNQIAKMVNQQGSPPLKRLRISADASQAPAIIKALPDIQKAVLSPGLKIEKRESTLMTKNLPSPTLSDPTPTTEAFEPAVDPDKEHVSWVRKPLKDPDARPFQWDDDEEGDGEGTENNNRIAASNRGAVTTAPIPAKTISTTTSSTASSSTATDIAVQSISVESEKSENNRLASDMSSNTKSISETESKSLSLTDVPVPENFSEPPILTKEVPILKSTGGKEKEDLQMPRIAASNVTVSDASTSQESVVTFMLNDNHEFLLLSGESGVGSSAHSSSSSSHHMVSNKDFFSVSHPLSSSSSSTSTSTTTMSPFGSSIPTVKVMNKPKTYWDLQHKNTLRRLPNRGLVSTSNLSFPSASRRVTKSPNAPPIIPTATSSAPLPPSTPPATTTTKATTTTCTTASSFSSSSSTGTSEK